MPERHIRFGKYPELEGKWAMPEGALKLAVFSHPHPEFGGDMDNNVVRLVCHSLNRLGYATLRFNFRSVGDSEGSFDRGKGEQQDLFAACHEARHLFENEQAPIALIGYSFGAWVNWRALEGIDLLEHFVMVSPPFELSGFHFQPRDRIDVPISVFIGDSDQFCPLPLFEKEITKIGKGIWHEVVKGMDHFWFGKESELADKIAGRLG